MHVYACTHNRRLGYTTHVAVTRGLEGEGAVEKRDTSRLGSIRLRGSERRDWSRDGCIVSCRRCSADWLHPGSVDCTLRFRRVSNRAISSPRPLSLPRLLLLSLPSAPSLLLAAAAAAAPLFPTPRTTLLLYLFRPFLSAIPRASHPFPSPYPPPRHWPAKKPRGYHKSTPPRNSARLIPWIYQSSTFFQPASLERVFKVLGGNTVNAYATTSANPRIFLSFANPVSHSFQVSRINAINLHLRFLT